MLNLAFNQDHRGGLWSAFISLPQPTAVMTNQSPAVTRAGAEGPEETGCESSRIPLHTIGRGYGPFPQLEKVREHPKPRLQLQQVSRSPSLGPAPPQRTLFTEVM